MGKFGIGARVRDLDGDIGVIVEKPYKGARTVEYNDTPHLTPGFLMTWLKEELTPVEAPVVAEATTWVPKVGDRVRRVAEGYSTVCPIGFETEITKIEGGRIWYIDVDGDETSSDAGSSVWEPATAPAPLAIEAGKFYRTRDGRKVGPILVWGDGRFHVKSDTVCGNQLWFADGSAILDDTCNDLVAEWVDEPTVEFKAGDRVRRIAEPWGFVPLGYEATVEAKWDGTLQYVDIEGDHVDFNPDNWELITPAANDNLVVTIAAKNEQVAEALRTLAAELNAA